eukprot:m.250588 g.250588  ORF g.250588 m.250588 type:complete len:1718 (+) comp16785_c0_seq1:95-5248(+)
MSAAGPEPFAAALRGSASDLERVVQALALFNPNMVDVNRRTLLYTACRGNVESAPKVRFLALHGADPRQPSGSYGSYPQHACVQAFVDAWGRRDFADPMELAHSIAAALMALQEAGANMWLENTSGLTALVELAMFASTEPNVPIQCTSILQDVLQASARLLASARPDLSALSRPNSSQLHDLPDSRLAQRAWLSPSMITATTAAWDPPNPNIIAIFSAAFQGDIARFDSLASSIGANAVDPSRGNTLLYTACRGPACNPDIVTLLLRRGASPLQPSGIAQSLPQHAVVQNYVEVMSASTHVAASGELVARLARILDELRAHGADFGRANSAGLTAHAELMLHSHRRMPHWEVLARGVVFIDFQQARISAVPGAPSPHDDDVMRRVRTALHANPILPDSATVAFLPVLLGEVEGAPVLSDSSLRPYCERTGLVTVFPSRLELHLDQNPARAISLRILRWPQLVLPAGVPVLWEYLTGQGNWTRIRDPAFLSQLDRMDQRLASGSDSYLLGDAFELSGQGPLTGALLRWVPTPVPALPYRPVQSHPALTAPLATSVLAMSAAHPAPMHTPWPPAASQRPSAAQSPPSAALAAPGAQSPPSAASQRPAPGVPVAAPVSPLAIAPQPALVVAPVSPLALAPQSALVTAPVGQTALAQPTAQQLDLVGAHISSLITVPSRTVPLNRCNIVLLGDSGAGKTATLRALLGQPFESRHISTLGGVAVEGALDTAAADAWTPAQGTGSELRRVLSAACAGPLSGSPVSTPSLLGGRTASGSAGVAPVTLPATPSPATGAIRDLVSNISLADLAQSAPVRYSILDMGGHPVLNDLQMLLLPRNSVYLICFDVASLMADELACAAGILRWLDVLLLRAPEARALLVATHGDRQPSGVPLATSVLDKHLQYHRAFPMIIESSAANTNKKSLVFLVNNAQSGPGSPHPSVLQLRAAIERAARAMPCTAAPVRIDWLALVDTVKQRASATQQAVVTRDSVEQLGQAVFGLSPVEVDSCLSFFSDNGLLLYDASERARDMVVLDPLWVVKAFSQLVRPAFERRIAFPGMHQQECIIEGSSLPALWPDSEYAPQQRAMLVSYLQKVHLLQRITPQPMISSNSSAAQSSSTLAAVLPSPVSLSGAYLVPSMLSGSAFPSSNLCYRVPDPSAGGMHGMVVCYFAFSLFKFNHGIVRLRDLERDHLLPPGAFVQLLCRLLDLRDASLQRPDATRQKATVSWCGVDVVIETVDHIGALRVSAPAAAMLPVYRHVRGILTEIRAQHFTPLQMFVLLPVSSESLISIDSLDQMREQALQLEIDGGYRRTVDELFPAFLIPHGVQDSYDIILCYRHDAESGTVATLHTQLTSMISLQTASRLTVFYDPVSVAKGRPILADCLLGMARSHVCVPVLSQQALTRMLLLEQHDDVDYLLLELHAALTLLDAGFIAAIFPIVVLDESVRSLSAFRRWAQSEMRSFVSRATVNRLDETLAGLFQQGLLPRLPAVQPLSVAAVVGRLLALEADTLGPGAPLVPPQYSERIRDRFDDVIRAIPRAMTPLSPPNCVARGNGSLPDSSLLSSAAFHPRPHRISSMTDFTRIDVALSSPDARRAEHDLSYSPILQEYRPDEGRFATTPGARPVSIAAPFTTPSRSASMLPPSPSSQSGTPISDTRVSALLALLASCGLLLDTFAASRTPLLLVENDMDDPIELAAASEADLVGIGITLGHARKIKRAFK